MVGWHHRFNGCEFAHAKLYVDEAVLDSSFCSVLYVSVVNACCF